MDGVSAVSAVLTLVAAVNGITRVAKAVYRSPAEMLELCNEVSDLHAITADINATLNSESGQTESSERLNTSLQKADTLLRSLDVFIRQRLLNNEYSGGQFEPVSSGDLSRRKWLMVRRRIAIYRTELQGINRELSDALKVLHL